jgi:hypothetical protein
MLLAIDELAPETGSDPSQIRSSVDEMRATLDCMSRRVLIVAERSPEPQ